MNDSTTSPITDSIAPDVNWKPSASLDNLRARADLLRTIRQFFDHKNVLEVETPLASRYGVTDVHLENCQVSLNIPQSDQKADNQEAAVDFSLQTSPEYAMKRLLAAGSGSIYQICKAFRNDELGRQHNPEFTLLEWYRTGFDHFDLMEEVSDLLQQTLNCHPVTRISYQQLFKQQLDIDPHQYSPRQLESLLENHLPGMNLEESEAIQALFTLVIEPAIGLDNPVIVYDFPKNQASLARLYRNEHGQEVAARFEVYFKGKELANGFFELADATEQHQRFNQDNQTRKRLAKTVKDIDYRLIAALQHGLPKCAGVALGIDRLLMAKLNAEHISQVLSFDINHC